MLSEAEGVPPSPPVRRRWPLIAWIIPDVVLALALTALLALPILLGAGLLRRAQGLNLFQGGELVMSPMLFFAMIVAQNLAFGLVVLLRVLYFARRPLRWLGVAVSQPLSLIGAGLAFGLGFLVLNVVLGIIFTSLGIEQNQAAQYPLRAGDPLGQLLIAAAGAILAPIVEELFFRGYVYGALRESLGPTIAMAGSAVLFSLAHVLSATQGLAALLIPVFLLGLLLAYLRERSDSLLPCIVAHMVNNAVGMAMLLYCVNVPGTTFCPK